MNKEEIKLLQERTYAISNSLLPLNVFFNDIRDNDNPRFRKDLAYQDFKLIVDEFYRLREEIKIPTIDEVKKEWEEDDWKWEEDYLSISLTKSSRVITIYTHNKEYDCTRFNMWKVGCLSIKEHQLLTKTFKALGWVND